MKTKGANEYRTATHPVTKVHSENRVGDTTHAVVEVSDEGDAKKRKMHLANSCKAQSRQHSGAGNQKLTDLLIDNTIMVLPKAIGLCLNIIRSDEDYSPEIFEHEFGISHSGTGNEFSETRDTITFSPGEKKNEVLFQRRIQVQGEDDIVQRAQLKLDPLKTGIEIEGLGAEVKGWEFAIRVSELDPDQVIPSFFYFDLEPIKE